MKTNMMFDPIRFATAIVALCLCSCASTTISENGQKVMTMQSNATNVTLQTPSGTFFHADVIDNSSATLAGAHAASQIVTAGAGAAGTIMTGVVGLQAVSAGLSPAVAIGTTAGVTAIHGAQGLVRPTNINVQTVPATVVPVGQEIVVQQPNGVVQTFRVARVTAKQKTVRRRHRATASPQYFAA
jgi:hypothetical protein